MTADNGKPRAPTKVENDPRTPEEIRREILSRHPIELEDRIDTLDDPLIIECAFPGWQSREWPEPDAYPGELPPNYERGGVRYPAVPCSIEEQVDEFVRAVEAGCAATHMHPRDPADCFATNDPDRIAEIYDRVYEEVDIVPLQHSWHRTPDDGIDFIDAAEALLERAGGTNRYIQGGLVLWPPGDRYPKQDYEECVEEGIEFYHDHGIKPIHKLRGSYHARRLQRAVEAGLPVEEPLVAIHDMGHPYGWPMDRDTWMPLELVSSIQQTKERFPDSVIGVYSGNRNWLPVTMMAILAGVDVVRVGIEDAYWMYPHRDEVIQRNIDCIRKVTDFCELAGRETASAEQAREILGM